MTSAPDRSSGDAGSSMTWTIPLELTVRLGAPRTHPLDPLRADPGRIALGAGLGGEKLVIDTRYSNRRGYAPSFLGTKVSLPKLDPQQKARAARKRKVKQGEDPFELKYQHFSVVMNSERRMAYFTAVNIDGGSWVHILRETGLPKESAEASEEWFEDRRILDEHQTHQDLYDAQKPKRLFDRGHLVRRQDPAWGSDAKAIKANADTHHFTNCVPQASTFNQRVAHWQGIEQWILEDNAVADDEKVTVFTGPVFDDDDKEYRYVKVPRQFWKVVVFVSNGKPRAVAVLADQSKWLKSLPESIRADGSEALDEVPQALEEYQSSVAEIEALTGLDFGKVRDWDTNGAEGIRGPEALAGRRRVLRRFEDLLI
jgi:endonuclease G